MIDKQGRKLLNEVITPISRRLPHFITPNIMTVIALVFGLMSISAIIQEQVVIATLMFSCNRIADAFDGNIARNTNRESKYGFIYDIVADFFIYAAIPIAISIHNGDRIDLIITCVLLATYYINAGIWMSLSKVTSPKSTGLIEGFETTVFYILFILFPQHFVVLGSIFATLISITIALRFITLIRTSST